jgi:hypothetical protein
MYFAIKAIYKLQHVDFGHGHFVKASTISALAEKIEKNGVNKKKDIIRMDNKRP